MIWKSLDFMAMQAYHQESLDNLRAAQAKTKKLCAVCLDTMGPEIVVVNRCAARAVRHMAPEKNNGRKSCSTLLRPAARLM